MRKKHKQHSHLPGMLIVISIVTLVAIVIYFSVPIIAENAYGSPNPALESWQRFNFASRLVLDSSDLLKPLDINGVEQYFVIENGEDALKISNRLEHLGLISDAKIFRIYLAWTGMDTSIQVGTYRLSPAMSPQTIAGMLQSTTMTEVSCTILPGWRVEEVASSVEISGLGISVNDFLAAADAYNLFPDIIPEERSVEGFLFPGSYILPRSATPEQIVSIFVQSFFANLPEEYLPEYQRHGLTVYQAVTLASIIEREAVVDEEMPLIASVFYNRLLINMKLQADPTVQYALGYNALQETWWTNHLSAIDLQHPSQYNTYQSLGLPPGPISNPGLSALTAVAYPIQSTYYYFQARCDGSGFHNFAETFEQHEENYCP